MKKILNIVCVLIALYGSNVVAQCAGCPTVNAQLATGPQTLICLGQSANLTASATPVLGANTNAYTVTSIPYAPQPYSGGVVGVSNCDDCWGQTQNLPFTFCYYGNAFNQFVCGSNGMVTFNTAMAGGYCAWPIPGGWPSIAGCGTGNVIGLPWRDINMGNGTAARWYVSGTAPNRTLVIYYQNVPLYSCGNPTSYLQLILYETTSVIELHIQNSSNCGWNSGAGIAGIQNATGLIGSIPPGRNFPPGGWTATNEAWRFSPSPAVPSWTWTSPTNPSVGNGTAVTVSPTVTTTYSAYCVAGCPPGTVQVVVNNSPTLNPTSNSPICQGGTLNLQSGLGGGANTTYSWTGPNTFTSNIQNPSIANAQPSMSGVYSLVAANNFTNGPSCIGPVSMTTVNIVPVAQISVTPQFTLCTGASLNLTANSPVPPTSYSWTGPNAFTSNVQNPTIANTTTLNSGNYIAMASFSTVGVPLACTSTAVANVSIVATSPVTVTMPPNICEHMTANVTVSANPTPSYVWAGPNGFTSTLSAFSIPNIQPINSGLYNATAFWSIGTVTCQLSAAGQINVVAVPPIAINAPTSVCYPSNVNLTSSSPGAISYSWSSTSGFTSNIASPMMGAPLPSVSGIYSVTTAYTNGALICYNTNTTQVTVNPIIPFSLSPAYRQMCFNTTYTVGGPPGATSYTWNGPNGFTSNNQVMVIPAIQSGMGGTYTLEVSLGPCKTSSTTKVDVLSPISFTQTPGNKIICKGDSVKLYMGSTGGSQNYAYVWNPQQYLSSPTGSFQAGLPGGTTIYNVTGYDIACPFYTISTSFTVTVNEAPKPDLKLNKYEGCEPFCLHYKSNTESEASVITYDFGNGNMLQADDFDYCLDQGTYNLKIKTLGKNGCSAIYEQPAPIVVHPKPHSELNFNPEAPSTTQNNVTFEPSNQYGPIESYYWEFKGSKNNSGFDTSSLKNPVRTYDEIGKYPVLLISKTVKGCIDTVFKLLEIKDEFSIFIPNTFTPNGDNLNDVFNIKGVGLKAEGYSMEIYDRWGTLVYSTKEIMKGWDGTIKGILGENAVYVYKVKALGANGEGKKEFTGHVTLLK